MKIPVARPYLDQEEIRAASDAIKSGWVSQGPRVAEFEKIFADYVNAKHAVATTSCTTALHLALIASGIEPGDEVIIPSLSFIATANSVVHAGATPVFADINPATCNLDPEAVEKAITGKTKAIMPVHQMGLPADIDAFKDIAQRYALGIIEDAACAIGSEYKEKKIGGTGQIACFSFHPRKIITTGEGGMITTDDDEIATRLKRLRHHGMSVSDLERHKADKVIMESYLEIGYNYRMTDIQAAMGIVQMEKLPEILRLRGKIAARYNKAFSNFGCLRVPRLPGYVTRHNYQSYWLEVLEGSPVSRNKLMEKLLGMGVSSRRGIMAIHKEPCYYHLNADLPNTEQITQNTIILPIYPSMSDNEADFVIECVSSILC